MQYDFMYARAVQGATQRTEPVKAGWCLTQPHLR